MNAAIKRAISRRRELRIGTISALWVWPRPTAATRLVSFRGSGDASPGSELPALRSSSLVAWADSDHQFADGYFLSRDAMRWFWDQYTTDEDERNEITASPLRVTSDDLASLPKALVITGEATCSATRARPTAENTAKPAGLSRDGR
jgi:alpha/beta hydrolase fold